MIQLDTSEKRILLFTVVPVLFLLYEYLYSNSMYNNADAYNEVELTIGNVLFYITVVFSMMWLGVAAKTRKPSSIAILLFPVIPVMLAYGIVAIKLFALGA